MGEEDILDKTSRIVTSAIKQEIPRKQGEDEQLKLMTKMLNDIETKVLIIEDMERDTNCMLSRADHLQMKTKFLEKIKKKKKKKKNFGKKKKKKKKKKKS